MSNTAAAGKIFLQI